MLIVNSLNCWDNGGVEGSALLVHSFSYHLSPSLQIITFIIIGLIDMWVGFCLLFSPWLGCWMCFVWVLVGLVSLGGPWEYSRGLGGYETTSSNAAAKLLRGNLP